MKHRNALEAVICSAAALYHKAVFVVGMDSTRRSDSLATLAGGRDWSVVNVGLALSESLLDVPHRHRAASVPQVMADLLDGIHSAVVILDNIEILFAPQLAQDPVKLIQGLSRNRTLVVSWPGVCDGTALSYATLSHPEYYRQVGAELAHVNIEDTEIIPQNDGDKADKT